ncbi:MAG: sigma-70 family RNA polymerase sigma factor [Leadbetterella sp.]|nr:sigma-70 family RNA polymerase sigma factor [Leadbetterella sp.]
MLNNNNCREIKGLKEEEILVLLKSQENIFTCIYQKHKSYCLNFLKQKGASKEEAYDIYQDAVIVLYEKSKVLDFKLTCSFQTYLISICYNKLKTKWGSKENKMTIPIDISIEDSYTDWYDDEETEIKEKLDKIKIALDELKRNADNCHERLRLFYYEKLSNSEIAKTLNLKNANVVKNLIGRCKEVLKKMVGVI